MVGRSETAASHLTLYSSLKMCAFTLAEVLITLGIIGVVAAMTLPTVINKTNQVALNNQYKKAYSTYANAQMASRQKWGAVPLCYYGSGIANDYTECAKFSKVFLGEFKIAHSCGDNAIQKGCIPKYKGFDEIEKINNPDYTDDQVASAMVGCTNLSKAKLYSYPAFILSDGTIIMPANGINHLASNLLIDINGKKGPNKWGYDLFYFYTYYNGKKFLDGGYWSSRGCTPREKGGLTPKQMFERTF